MEHRLEKPMILLMIRLDVYPVYDMSEILALQNLSSFKITHEASSSLPFTSGPLNVMLLNDGVKSGVKWCGFKIAIPPKLM